MEPGSCAADVAEALMASSNAGASGSGEAATTLVSMRRSGLVWAASHPFSVLLVMLVVASALLAHQALAALRERSEFFAGGHNSNASILTLLSYRLDVWFTSSPSSKPLLLLWLTVALILVGWGALWAAAGGNTYDAFWAAVEGSGLDWTFADDVLPPQPDGGGSGAADVPAHPSGPPAAMRAVLVRVVGLMVSVGGMLVTALLLGIVSEAISNKVDELRRGKSPVLESNHALIIGWNDKIFTLIEQLCIGFEIKGGKPIVVLSDMDKEMMDDELATHLGGFELRGSRVICRKGDPLIASELDKVSVQHASAIVILADFAHPDRSDARLLRVLMTLAQMHRETRAAQPGGSGAGLRANIVAEVCNQDHEALLHTLASGLRLSTIMSQEMVGRMMVQCARYPQLARVMEELIGFDGNEFYCDNTHVSSLAGVEFKALQELFPTAVPMGIQSRDGTIYLNPKPETTLLPDDSVVLLAEDELMIKPCFPKDWTPPALQAAAPAPGLRMTSLKAVAGLAMTSARLLKRARSIGQNAPPKNSFGGLFLFCGWRRDIVDLIRVLDEFVARGSELWLFNDVPLAERLRLLREGGLEIEEEDYDDLYFDHDEDNPNYQAARRRRAAANATCGGGYVLTNLRLVWDAPELYGHCQHKRHLERLFPLQFTSILILANEAWSRNPLNAHHQGDTSSVNQAADSDSRSMATLMLLRQIQMEQLPRLQAAAAAAAAHAAPNDPHTGAPVIPSSVSAAVLAVAAGASGGSITALSSTGAAEGGGGGNYNTRQAMLMHSGALSMASGSASGRHSTPLERSFVDMVSYRERDRAQAVVQQEGEEGVPSVGGAPFMSMSRASSGRRHTSTLQVLHEEMHSPEASPEPSFSCAPQRPPQLQHQASSPLRGQGAALQQRSSSSLPQQPNGSEPLGAASRQNSGGSNTPLHLGRSDSAQSQHRASASAPSTMMNYNLLRRQQMDSSSGSSEDGEEAAPEASGRKTTGEKAAAAAKAGGSAREGERPGDVQHQMEGFSQIQPGVGIFVQQASFSRNASGRSAHMTASSSDCDAPASEAWQSTAHGTSRSSSGVRAGNSAGGAAPAAAAAHGAHAASSGAAAPAPRAPPAVPSAAAAMARAHEDAIAALNAAKNSLLEVNEEEEEEEESEGDDDGVVGHSSRKPMLTSPLRGACKALPLAPRPSASLDYNIPPYSAAPCSRQSSTNAAAAAAIAAVNARRTTSEQLRDEALGGPGGLVGEHDTASAPLARMMPPALAERPRTSQGLYGAGYDSAAAFTPGGGAAALQHLPSYGSAALHASPAPPGGPYATTSARTLNLSESVPRPRRISHPSGPGSGSLISTGPYGLGMALSVGGDRSSIGGHPDKESPRLTNTRLAALGQGLNYNLQRDCDVRSYGSQDSQAADLPSPSPFASARDEEGAVGEAGGSSACPSAQGGSPRHPFGAVPAGGAKSSAPTTPKHRSQSGEAKAATPPSPLGLSQSQSGAAPDEAAGAEGGAAAAADADGGSKEAAAADADAGAVAAVVVQAEAEAPTSPPTDSTAGASTTPVKPSKVKLQDIPTQAPPPSLTPSNSLPRASALRGGRWAAALSTVRTAPSSAAAPPAKPAAPAAAATAAAASDGAEDGGNSAEQGGRSAGRVSDPGLPPALNAAGHRTSFSGPAGRTSSVLSVISSEAPTESEVSPVAPLMRSISLSRAASLARCPSGSSTLLVNANSGNSFALTKMAGSFRGGVTSAPSAPAPSSFSQAGAAAAAAATAAKAGGGSSGGGAAKGVGVGGSKDAKPSLEQWLENVKEVVEHTVIVSEVLDSKSVGLIKEANISEVVTSNDYVSKLLAMVADSPERLIIFKTLFSHGGNELYIRPSRWLLLKEEVTSFNTLSQRALNSGEVLLGYIKCEGRKMVLNPLNKHVPDICRKDMEALITIGYS